MQKNRRCNTGMDPRGKRPCVPAPLHDSSTSSLAAPAAVQDDWMPRYCWHCVALGIEPPEGAVIYAAPRRTQSAPPPVAAPLTPAPVAPPVEAPLTPAPVAPHVTPPTPLLAVRVSDLEARLALADALGPVLHGIERNPPLNEQEFGALVHLHERPLGVGSYGRVLRAHLTDAAIAKARAPSSPLLLREPFALKHSSTASVVNTLLHTHRAALLQTGAAHHAARNSILHEVQRRHYTNRNETMLAERLGALVRLGHAPNFSLFYARRVWRQCTAPPPPVVTARATLGTSMSAPELPVFDCCHAQLCYEMADGDLEQWVRTRPFGERALSAAHDDHAVALTLGLMLQVLAGAVCMGRAYDLVCNDLFFKNVLYRRLAPDTVYSYRLRTARYGARRFDVCTHGMLAKLSDFGLGSSDALGTPSLIATLHTHQSIRLVLAHDTQLFLHAGSAQQVRALGQAPRTDGAERGARHILHLGFVNTYARDLLALLASLHNAAHMPARVHAWAARSIELVLQEMLARRKTGGADAVLRENDAYVRVEDLADTLALLFAPETLRALDIDEHLFRERATVDAVFQLPDCLLV